MHYALRKRLDTLNASHFYNVGLYLCTIHFYSSDACKYIVNDCTANIVVVEDEKQLEKILKFKSETPCLKVIIHYCKSSHLRNVSELCLVANVNKRILTKLFKVL